MQFFAVVRHSERADGAFAYINGQRWAHTADSKTWPVDPPLSEEGHTAAKDIAMKIKEFAATANSTLKTVVVTSPYCRCVQTAAPIAQALRARMLVDCQIGEVYGPQVMGVDEPANAVKPIGSMLADVPDFEKRLLSSRIVGTWPAWPEDLKRARQRFAMRFLTYLRRSEKVHRNFILVSHADCVGATLSLLPSHAGQIVAKIDYCGTILASRSAKLKEAGMLSRQVSRGLAAAASVVSWSRTASNKTFASHSEDDEEFTAPDDSPPQDLRFIQESEGWKVELSGILSSSGERDQKAFQRRAKSMAKKGPFSVEQIEQMLGSSMPGDTLSDGKSSMEHDHASESTLLFGVSMTETSIASTSGLCADRRTPKMTKDNFEEITKQLAKARHKRSSKMAQVLLAGFQENGEGGEGDSQEGAASGTIVKLQPSVPAKGLVVMDLGKSSVLNRRLA